MAGGNRKEKLTKTAVDAALPEAKTYIVWDADLRGFGMKVTAQGVKTYVVVYRESDGGRRGQQRQFKIGRHGALTPAQARTEAERRLASVHLGANPQADRDKMRADLTVNELIDHYLDHGTGHKKASTLKADLSRIKCHIRPLLGTRPQASITSQDVERFKAAVKAGKTAKREKTGPRRLSNVRGGRGAATRTLALLGAVFTYAQKTLKIRSDNPCADVKRDPDRKCERFLAVAEIGALGAAMEAREATGANLQPLQIIRLWLQTGARRNEIESLKWSEVYLERRELRLGDSKTGQKIVPLGEAACDLIRTVTRTASPYVFPAGRGGKLYYQGAHGVFASLCKAAGLGHVRPHDLRHSFGSLAAASGVDLLVIGKIMGHRDPTTTMRYVHFTQSIVANGAETTASNIESALKSGAPKQADGLDNGPEVERQTA